MLKIGVMQGRLLPRYKKRYQSHPVNYWQAEFYIARDLGFNQIEFILDFNDVEENPLMSKQGITEILNMCKATGIHVKSICADYFMEAPFHSQHQKKSEKILKKLIKHAKKLGVVDIVIPCVDHSTLKDDNDMNMLVSSINKVLPIAEKAGIYINFETDLSPKRFKKLLAQFDSSYVKVNYDIGNSASLGYDPVKEFKAYGKYISDLHIKDRVLGGGSVELGTGDANMEKVFSLLKQYNFKGNIIMQAAREEEYTADLRLIKKQKKLVKKLIKKYL